MEWTLRLVGIGIDGQSRSFDVMAISRPDRGRFPGFCPGYNWSLVGPACHFLEYLFASRGLSRPDADQGPMFNAD
jgi:hypothetical protein